nr:ycf3-interacting protein 1, chloroplastic [Ipomoea batatas]
MPATRRKPALLPQPPLPPKRKERTMKMWRSQMRKPLNTSPKSKEFWSCSRRIGIWCLVSHCNLSSNAQCSVGLLYALSVKLTIMIEDPRDVDRKRLLGIDDENAPTREDLAAALEEDMFDDGFGFPRAQVYSSPTLAAGINRREGHCYEHGRVSGEGKEYRCHRPPSTVTPPITSLLAPPERQERHRLAASSARLLLSTNGGPRMLLLLRRSTLGTREMTPLLYRKKGGRHGRTRRRRSRLHREEERELCMLPQLETASPMPLRIPRCCYVVGRTIATA